MNIGSKVWYSRSLGRAGSVRVFGTITKVNAKTFIVTREGGEYSERRAKGDCRPDYRRPA